MSSNIELKLAVLFPPTHVHQVFVNGRHDTVAEHINVGKITPLANEEA
jgi:hypothetical protein